MPADTATLRLLDAVLAARTPEALSALVAQSVDTARMARQLEIVRLQWGACTRGTTIAGDGTSQTDVRLACERGVLIARMTLSPEPRRIARFDLIPSREQTCAQ